MSKSNDSNLFGWTPIFPLSQAQRDKNKIDQLEERVKALEVKLNAQKA